jgi:hypothetical protein
MRIRGRLFRTMAVVVLTGFLAGSAIAGEAVAAPPERSAPPQVQVMADGSVVFTAVPNSTRASTQAVIVCQAVPWNPTNFPHNPGIITFSTTVSCDSRVVMLYMDVTLIHYNNWWVTRSYQEQYANYLWGNATKSCVNGWYGGKAEVTVTFGIDWNPPSITRTFFADDVFITTC